MYIADDMPANNSLKVLPDGIILLTQTGHQTKASSQQFHEKIEGLVDERRKSHQKALILVDLTGITGHDSDVRDSSRDMLKSDFDALALFGENVTVRMIANWLIKSAGQADRVQFFETQQEATDWLRSH